jgi:WD40 repeat protein
MKTWQQTLEDIEFEIRQKNSSFQTRIEIDRYLLERGYNPVDIDLVWEKLQKSERPRHWLLHTGRGVLTQWAIITLVVGLVLVIWRPFDRPDYITIASPEKFNFADVAYSPDGRYLSGLDTQGQLFIWQLPERRLLKAYDSSNERHKAAGRIFWSADSHVVLTTSGYAVQVFRLEDDQTIFTELSRNTPPLATLSPDSKYVAITQYPNQVVLYDLATGTEVKKTKNEWKYDVKLNTIKFSPDSKVLAIECMNTIWLWNIETDEQTMLQPPATDAAINFGDKGQVFIEKFNFSQDGQRLALTVRGNGQQMQLWNWVSNSFLGVTPTSFNFSPHEPVFSPDGNFVVLSVTTNDYNKNLLVVPTSNPTEARLIKAPTPTNAAASLTFSPDGKKLVFATENKLLLWNADKLR